MESSCEYTEQAVAYNRQKLGGVEQFPNPTNTNVLKGYTEPQSWNDCGNDLRNEKSTSHLNSE